MAGSIAFDLIARDRASATFSKVGQNADGLSKKLGGLGKAAAAGMAAATAGLAAGLGVAINKAMSFDKTIRQVGVMTNESGAGLKTLSDLAMKMGKETVFSAADASAAMLELAKGGMNAAQIKGGVLQGTMTLAAAGELQMADAATYLSNALNMFGLQAKDSATVVAALSGGSIASSASVESLGLALSQVGPSAKLAGANVQTTVGILAAFDNAGVKGQDAGTSLKTMFMRLVPQTAKASNAMRDLGLKFTDAKGAFLPMRDVAEQLHTKLGKLSAAQKTTALTTIFGTDAFRAAAIMSDLGAAGVDKYTAATSDLAAAQKLANVGMTGAAGAWENFKGTVETLGISLGITLLPAFTNIVNFVNTSVLPMFDKVVSFIHDTLIPAFGTAADKLKGPLVAAYTYITTTLIPNIKTEFGKVRDAFATMLDNVDFVNVGKNLFESSKAWAMDLINGVQIGVDTGDWSALGKTIGEKIAQAVKGAGKLIAKIGGAIGELLGKVDWVDLGLRLGKQVPSLLAGLAVGILTFDMGGLLRGLGHHWFETILAALAVAFLPGAWITKVAELLARIPLIGPLLGWFLNAFRGVARPVFDAIGHFLGFVGDAFVAGFRSVFPRVGGEVATFVTNLPTYFRVLASEFKDKAVAAMNGLFDGLAAGVFRVVAKVGELVANIIGYFIGAGTWLLAAGASIIVGLVAGIGGKIATVYNKFGEILTYLGHFGSDVTVAARGIWDGIGDAFKGMIRGILGLWNNLHFDVPSVDLGPLGKIGGQRIDFPNINIPGLAEGGIVKARSGGMLALLGEGGRDEAVIPLGAGTSKYGAGVTVNNITVNVPGYFGTREDLETGIVRVLDDAARHGRLRLV